MSDQIHDHPYTGELRRGASCQYVYTDAKGGICARMASEHGDVPTVQPVTAPTPVQPEDLAVIPLPYRRTVARWLMERGGRVQASLLCSARTAAAIDEALTGCGVDLADPLSEDSTTAHAATIAAGLRVSPRTRVALSTGDPGKWQAQYYDPDLTLWCDIGDAQADRADAETRERNYRVEQASSQGAVIVACTHGDGCPVHPDVHALHNFDATAAEVLDEVLAAVLIRHKFDAEDVREIAARHGLELRR